MSKSENIPSSVVSINGDDKETSIAIIGSGPCCFGILWGFERRIGELEIKVNKSEDELRELEKLKKTKFVIFEKSSIIGTGFPYNDSQFDLEHALNVKAVSSYIPGRKDVNEKTDEFFQYLVQNKSKLEETVDNVFKERLKAGLERRFGTQYSQADNEMEGDNDNITKEGEHISLQQNVNGLLQEDVDSPSDEEKDKREFIEYRNRLLQHFKNRYLNFEDTKDVKAKNKFYPRIFYGMYQMQMFRDAIEKLRNSGVTVEERPNTDVIDLDENTNLTFEQKAKTPKQEKFDQVIIATGRFYVAPTPEEKNLKRYISNPWPVSKLNSLIDEEIQKRAKSQDKNKVIKIAIEGSGPSAIDVIKTIFKDIEYDENGVPNIEQFEEYKGCKIEVTMILRSNNLRVVDVKSVDVERVGKEDVNKLIKFNKNGQIYLWQLIELSTQKFLDHCYQNYENPSYDKKSIEFGIKQAEYLLELIHDEQNKKEEFFKYDKILDELEKISTSMGGKTPEERLEINLELSKSEKVNSYAILPNILYDLPLVMNELPLPEDEKALLDAFNNIYERVVIGPLPRENAQFFSNLSRAGILKFEQANANQKSENGDCIQYGDDENSTKFDLAISAKGHPLDVTQNTSVLFQNMLKRGIISTNTIVVGFGEKEEVEKRLFAKFGKSAKKIIDKLRVVNENVVYENNSTSLDKNKHPIDKDGIIHEKILYVSNQRDGIAATVKSGVKAVSELIRQLTRIGSVGKVLESSQGKSV